jgi:RNA polymerase sigma factor (sigma-70 family)
MKNYMKIIIQTAREALDQFMSELKQFPRITPEREKELIEKAKAGDESARDEFLSSNMRLVVKIASRYRDRGVELSDLIEEGAIGMMKALDSFDPSLGFRFSTYAYQKIEKSIQTAIANTGRTVRIPVHALDKIKNIQKIKKTLSNELGHEPSLADIAEATGHSVAEISEILNGAQARVPLDKGLGEDGGEVIGDRLASPDKSPESIAFQNKETDMIYKVLGELQDEREREVVKLRFGLSEYEGQKFTLDQIAEKLGLTRERIRQIEEEALQKLKKAIMSQRRKKSYLVIIMHKVASRFS